MNKVTDILEKLEQDEHATCAVLGKLQEFIVEVSRSSNLSDIWASWSSISLPQEIHCNEIKSCNQSACPAFNNPKEKCWLLETTPCCSTVSSYAEKITRCFDCKVMAGLRENTPVFLNELTNILIKFLMHRDKELLTIAIKDSLTKCYNRYYFDEYTDHLLKDANRHGDVITIMAIDIDKFKTANDVYGHAAGDSVLIAVTELLTKAVRSNDMIFRMGGDEFLVVFPRTECCEIISIRDRLFALVNEWNTTSTLPKYKLSMSIGCVTWNPGENFTTKLAEADAAMYVAKNNGGNAVEICK